MLLDVFTRMRFIEELYQKEMTNSIIKPLLTSNTVSHEHYKSAEELSTSRIILSVLINFR